MRHHETLDQLDRTLTTQLAITEEAIRLADLLRSGKRPEPIEDHLFIDPPLLGGAGDPRLADLYQRLWDHRDDVLAR